MIIINVSPLQKGNTCFYVYSINLYDLIISIVYFRILKKDPYHNSCLPVHIACLVELKKTNGKYMCFHVKIEYTIKNKLYTLYDHFSALFYLAHKLVDLYPDMALAWFAVGCYYYSLGNYHFYFIILK